MSRSGTRSRLTPPTPAKAPVHELKIVLNPGADRERIERLREMISEKVGKHPDKAAIILTDWIKKNS